MLPRLILSTALFVLLAAAPAAAEAPWSAPVQISTTHTSVNQAGVAVTRDGTAVAAWTWQQGTDFATATTGSAVAFRNIDGTWTPEKAFRGMVSGPPVTHGARGYTLVTDDFSRRNASRSTLAVLDGRVGFPTATRHEAVTGINLTRHQLAGNAAGVQALAWMQRNGGTRDRVYVALRRKPGRAFGKPRLIARERIRNVSVAVSPRGEVLVAWDARGLVRTRIKRPGHGFGRTQTIRSKPAYTHELRTAITRSGRAYVAWTAQLLTEGGDAGRGYVQASWRPAGKRFRGASLLERLPRGVAVRGLALTTADVAWMGHEGSSYVVRHAPLGATIGAPRDLPGGAGDFDVTDLAGRTLMLGRFEVDTVTQVLASQDFDAPEPVTPAAGGQAFGGRAAILRDGRPVAVWIDRGTVQSAVRG